MPRDPNRRNDSGWETLAKISTGVFIGLVAGNEEFRKKVVDKVRIAANTVTVFTAAVFTKAKTKLKESSKSEE